MLSKDIGTIFAPEIYSGSSGKCHLLAIGINQYRHVARLYNAVRDVEKLIQVLTLKYQFDSKYVTQLKDEEATEERILKELDLLIEKAKPEDSVLIYFSGHGAFKDNVDQGYWVPVEGKFNDSSSTISNSTVIDHLKAVKARHLLLIVDACFGGTLISQTRGGQAVKIQESIEGEESYYREVAQVPSRWLMTSGRKEPVLDGVPGQHSPFANHLLNTLKINSKKLFSTQELGREIARAMSAEKYDQLPFSQAWTIDAEKTGGEFVFEIVRDPGPALDSKDWQMDTRKPHFLERIPRRWLRPAVFILFVWILTAIFLWSGKLLSDEKTPLVTDVVSPKIKDTTAKRTPIGPEKSLPAPTVPTTNLQKNDNNKSGKGVKGTLPVTAKPEPSEVKPEETPKETNEVKPEVKLPPPPPQIHIISQNPINLGRIKAGSKAKEKANFILENEAGTSTEDIEITISDPGNLELSNSPSFFKLNAGDSRTIKFTFTAPGEAGKTEQEAEIKGIKSGFSRKIRVSATIFKTCTIPVKIVNGGQEEVTLVNENGEIAKTVLKNGKGEIEVARDRFEDKRCQVRVQDSLVKKVIIDCNQKIELKK